MSTGASADSTTPKSAIAGYRVVRKLGAGQMGDVFEAQSPKGPRVAVKVLRFAGHDRSEVHQRFAREARLSATLQHSNVVQVIDRGIDDGSPYLVMPLLVGRDLESWLDDTGPLSPSVAVSIVFDAARGLAAAHAKGIVHRDFKPANVMLHEDPDGTVIPIVCDFGVAKSYDEDGTLTASGAVLGTPLFMAPEQFIDCKRVDARCDVWALGMTLFHALAGRPALVELKGIGDLLVALKHNRIPSVQSTAPWVPPALARVVHAALLPLDKRFASVDDFIAALERWGPKRVPLTRSAIVPASAEERQVSAAPSGPVLSASDLGSPDDATMLDRTNPKADADDDLVGTTIAERYEIRTKLGSGGMGAVYDAIDRSVPEGSRERSVAVKVMLGESGSKNTESSRRFLREGRSAQRVTSPHAATVLDVGVDPKTGAHYLVMERLRGRDLGEILRETSALAPEVAVSLVLQACDGVASAHAMGIVHRDIKPSNLFVHEASGTLVVKVCDFGIAKQLATESSGGDSTELTHTGGLLGSPLYMSPEQAKSAKNVDARSDIFSLTLSLHEALSGRRPWEGRTSMGEIIVAVVTEDVPSLCDYAPWVDPQLADIVAMGVARDVTKRIATIAALAEALRPFGLRRALTRDDLVGLSKERRGVVHETLRDRARENSKSASASGSSTADAVSITGTGASPTKRGPMVVVAALAIAIAAGAGVFVWSQKTPRVEPAREGTQTATTTLPSAASAPSASASSDPRLAAAPSASVLAAPSASIATGGAPAPIDPRRKVKPPPPHGGTTSTQGAASAPAATAAAGTSSVGRGATATDLPGELIASPSGPRSL